MTLSFKKVPEEEWNLPDYEAVDAVDQVSEASKDGVVVGYLYRLSPKRRWLAHILNPPDARLAAFSPGLPPYLKRDTTYGAALSGWKWTRKDAVEWLSSCVYSKSLDSAALKALDEKLRQSLDEQVIMGGGWAKIAVRKILRVWGYAEISLEKSIHGSLRVVLESNTHLISSELDGVTKRDVLALYLYYGLCDPAFITQEHIDLLIAKVPNIGEI